MTSRIAEELNSSEVETQSAAGPVRLRRAKRARTTARARKSRRKATTHAGIHLRANKRMAW
jgi:hypothetical protein